MKIKGFRWTRVGEGVDLLEFADTEMSLRDVLQEEIRGLEEGVVEGVEITGMTIGPGRLVFKNGPPPVTGILVHDSARSLTRFLLDHVAKTGHPEIDAILAKTGPDRRADLRELITALSGEAYWDPNLLEMRGKGIRKPFMLRPTFTDLLSRGTLRSVTIGDGRWFMAAADGQVLFLRDEEIEFRGLRIPRRMFLACSVRDDDGRHGSYQYVGFDGERSHVANRIKEIPRMLLDELETNGMVVRGNEFEAFPRPDFEPVALVKVPPMGADIQNLTTRQVPEPPIRGDGFFVCDTRDPVPLPEIGPIIEAPELAFSIMARVREGVFYQGEEPRIRDAVFQGKGYFVTLNRVRG